MDWDWDRFGGSKSCRILALFLDLILGPFLGPYPLLGPVAWVEVELHQ